MKCLFSALLLSLILLSASKVTEASWVIDGERFHVSVHGGYGHNERNSFGSN
jgi:hypothetical protein